MADGDGFAPAIEVEARGRAKRVRFEKTPDTRVRYRGQFMAEEIHERENLPERVEAGVDYSDVGVSWRSAVWITDDDPAA